MLSCTDYMLCGSSTLEEEQMRYEDALTKHAADVLSTQTMADMAFMGTYTVDSHFAVAALTHTHFSDLAATLVVVRETHKCRVQHLYETLQMPPIWQELSTLPVD
jgi:hypothetical protein